MDNLPISPEALILLSSFLAAVLTVFALWSAFMHRDPMAAKAKELAERRLKLKEAATSGRDKKSNEKAKGAMREVVTRLNLLRSKHADAISKKLAQAGWRSHDAMVAYLFAKAILPLAAAALVGIFLLFGKLGGNFGPKHIMFSAGIVLFCAYLPDILGRMPAPKRKELLQKALPDGLDLMVICAEAGLSLDASMQRLSQEFGKSSPEFADEMALTSVELGFMPERTQALHNLSARTGLPGIRDLVNTLGQTEKYGTPLAQSLRVLSAEMRHERLMKAEEKAHKLPAMLTVPMILFILPPLFVILLGPAMLSVADNIIKAF